MVPAAETAAASQKAVLNADLAGTAVPTAAREATIAIATWAPSAPPTVRATVLIPFTVAVWVAGTRPPRSLGSAASASPDPSPTTR